MESTNILAEFSSQPIASCLNSGKRTSSCEPSILAGKTALGEEDSRQDTFPRVHRGGEAAPEKEGTPQPDEELDIKEKEEVVKRIFRSNSFSCDPHLPVCIYEEDESLIEDFGTYLSTLPPKSLSESDSLCFEISEEVMDSSLSHDLTEEEKTFFDQRGTLRMTRKQWQSCFDLFLTRNRSQLIKVTSKALLKRQVSFREQNTELLVSLQDRIRDLYTTSRPHSCKKGPSCSPPLSPPKESSQKQSLETCLLGSAEEGELPSKNDLINAGS